MENVDPLSLPKHRKVNTIYDTRNNNILVRKGIFEGTPSPRRSKRKFKNLLCVKLGWKIV